jgi:hypothetical protein
MRDKFPGEGPYLVTPLKNFNAEATTGLRSLAIGEFYRVSNITGTRWTCKTGSVLHYIPSTHVQVARIDPGAEPALIYNMVVRTTESYQAHCGPVWNSSDDYDQLSYRKGDTLLVANTRGKFLNARNLDGQTGKIESGHVVYLTRKLLKPVEDEYPWMARAVSEYKPRWSQQKEVAIALGDKLRVRVYCGHMWDVYNETTLAEGLVSSTYLELLAPGNSP